MRELYANMFSSVRPIDAYLGKRRQQSEADITQETLQRNKDANFVDKWRRKTQCEDQVIDSRYRKWSEKRPLLP